MEPTIQIANHAPPAVVRIHKRRRSGENHGDFDSELIATGILVSPDRVITAWHVVKDYLRESPFVWSVRHAVSGEERTIIGAEFHDHDQMDLAIAKLDSALPFTPLLWLSGSPDGDNFPSQGKFRVYGYPVENGGETLCEIVLPADALAIGREVQSRKVYRLELARTPTPGFSGGPCMLRLGGREACVGLAVYALLAGETTSVMRGADEILEFLKGHGISPERTPVRDFISEHESREHDRPRLGAYIRYIIKVLAIVTLFVGLELTRPVVGWALVIIASFYVTVKLLHRLNLLPPWLVLRSDRPWPEGH